MRQHKMQDKGSNLVGVGQYNERLVLQLIRRVGSLPKAEIARRTALSAQTVSVIIRRLIDQGLLCEQERQHEKGKIGQPVVPISLNPQGAYSIGIKIGRRSLDSLIIDFTGKILKRLSLSYPYPDPQTIFPKIEKDIQQLMYSLKPHERSRMVGIGIAAPYDLGGWQHEANMPSSVTEQWNKLDIKETIQAQQTLPVWFVNDATAACMTSLECPDSVPFNNYLYIFLGTFIGGGIVLNRTLFMGAHKNSGAIGSMPLPAGYLRQEQGSNSAQLINCASRYLLDESLQSLGENPDNALQNLADLPTVQMRQEVLDVFHHWKDQAASCLAYAISSAVSVIDFEGVVIDGILPPSLIRQMTLAVEREFEKVDTEGLIKPQIVAGKVGAEARALGGALLPFYANFAPDRDVLLRTERDATYIM